ncbi:MAG: hypothetical protein LBT66_04290 [Methanobrevibacter sp.]|nr:hypothetical protein [Candidatus Methanovirga meridionalis]
MILLGLLVFGIFMINHELQLVYPIAKDFIIHNNFFKNSGINSKSIHKLFRRFKAI